jgi:prophage regulatory protein
MAGGQTLITWRAVRERTSLSRATIYRKIADHPDFPRPVPLSERRVAWVEAEIDDYVAKRIAARTGNSTTDDRVRGVDRLTLGPSTKEADPMASSD